MTLPRIRPMRLRLVKEAFDNPDYIFELKHDGFRALAYIDAGESIREAGHNAPKFDHGQNDEHYDRKKNVLLSRHGH